MRIFVYLYSLLEMFGNLYFGDESDQGVCFIFWFLIMSLGYAAVTSRLRTDPAHRQAGIQADRQTDNQPDRQSGGQTDNFLWFAGYF